MNHQSLETVHDEHDRGLQHDLQAISRQLAERRRLLGYLLGGGASIVLAGCGGGGGGEGGATTAASGSSSTASGSSTVDSCVADPEETNGPYPSDGTNSVNGVVSNVLLDSGVVRSDIRPSFGGSSAVAGGVPLQLEITVVNTNGTCAPLSGWALYLWQCTADGLYSLYSNGVRNENFLRGVQVSDANGKLGFTTIFPGCYAGRYPHFHFELFQSLGVATGYVNRVLCSQMALPRDACAAVYATSGYGSSLSNLNGVSLSSDGIFGNNTAAQIAAQTVTLSGSAAAGYSGSIVVGVPW